MEMERQMCTDHQRHTQRKVEACLPNIQWRGNKGCAFSVSKMVTLVSLKEAHSPLRQPLQNQPLAFSFSHNSTRAITHTLTLYFIYVQSTSVGQGIKTNLILQPRSRCDSSLIFYKIIMLCHDSLVSAHKVSAFKLHLNQSVSIPVHKGQRKNCPITTWSREGSVPRI